MGKGGGDILKQAEQGVRDTGKSWSKDFWGQLGSTAVDYFSLGNAKLKGGKLDYGHNMSNFDEFTGALSGRNASRAAGYKEQDAINAAKSDADSQLAANRLQAYRADLNASKMAQSTRDAAAAKNAVSDNTPTAIANKLGTSPDDQLLGT